MGLFRMSIPDFDKRAVREAVVNAFSHRDYTQLGRVLVQMDEDGMTISNPGGLIEGVTVQNILNVSPRGRNPALADALKRIGLAERSGRGVDRFLKVLFNMVVLFQIIPKQHLPCKAVYPSKLTRCEDDHIDFGRTKTDWYASIIEYSVCLEHFKTRTPYDTS